MDAVLGLLDTLLPKWLLAALLAGALVHGCQVAGQLDTARVDLAGLKAQVAGERAERFRAASEDAQFQAGKQAAHAAGQQGIIDDYASKLTALEVARHTDAADLVGLRRAIAAYSAAGDRREGESDAAACQRAGDRLATLGGLLDEGAGLVVEGAGIVKRRDAEVALLLPLIANDRALLGGDAP